VVFAEPLAKKIELAESFTHGEPAAGHQRGAALTPDTIQMLACGKERVRVAGC